LEGCPRCREEFRAYLSLVGQTRKWLTEEKIQWEEGEWQQAVRSAVNQGAAKRTSWVPWPFPKAWAYALMAGVMLLITTLVVRPPFLERIGLTPPSGDVAEVKRQEVVSMTMVSEETGLKIVWFLNKNFDLEENE
jgi:hypothetical protein